jgi:VanZ family protein
MEYAFLAYLLYRAFRGVSRVQWRMQWMILSFMISFIFAVLDECVQIFIRNRTGSLLDVLVDTAGILSALGVIFLIHRKPTLPAAEFDRKT